MKYCVTVNNKRYEVEVEKGEAVIVSKKETVTEIVEAKDQAKVQAAATTIAPKVIEMTEKPVQANEVSAKEVVKAPMAGGITDVKVNVGTTVHEGDTLLILEAMKMENEITAHTKGIVAEIRVSKGSNVAADDVLVVIR